MGRGKTNSDNALKGPVQFIDSLQDLFQTLFSRARKPATRLVDQFFVFFFPFLSHFAFLPPPPLQIRCIVQCNEYIYIYIYVFANCGKSGEVCVDGK